MNSSPVLKSEVTPLPWFVGRDTNGFPGLTIQSEFGLIVRFPEALDAENQANAAFLVRAANSHEALVQALTLALPCVEYAEIETASQRLSTAHAKTVEALAHLRSALSKAKEA
jgi:hypothetical protein